MHNMKTLVEYIEFYCIIDGIQLIDVEGNFIMNLRERFELAPSFL